MSSQMPLGVSVRWSYETTLPGEPGSAWRARAFVSRHLLAHRLPHLVDPVRLTASELATQAVVRQDEFTMTLSELDDIVLLRVRHGPAPPAPEATPEQEPHSVAALSLKIVALVSLDCGVELDPQGVETAWASFARRRVRRPVSRRRRA
jgi:hypothetical protein